MSSEKKSWIKHYLISLAFMLVSFISFNYIVDPYGYNNQFMIEKINANKTQTEAQTRKFKIELAKTRNFNALFLGSSEMTFLGNTDYMSEQTNLKFFNLAFNEQEIYESLSYLKQILKTTQVQYIVLGLHPFKFDKNSEQYRQDTPENIFEGKDNLKTYLSYKTFIDSLKTIYKNYQNYLEIYDKNGWKIVDLLKYHHVSNEHSDEWLKSRVDQDPKLLVDQAKNFSLDMEKVEYLYEIIRLCREKNIKLQLLFTPMYYKHYLAIYQNMHKPMNKLKYLIAAEHPFYDFSQINNINLDYKNFVDRVSHARQSISYPLIDTLVNEDQSNGFGVYVKAENVDNYLKKSEKDLSKNP